MSPTKTRAAAIADFGAAGDLDDARKRLGEALPDDGWLGEYLRAVTPLTDTPVEFSLASGMCALSAALGNTLWLESWGQNVFPHLWIVLVAPSSFYRKSTAIGFAERVLRLAEVTRVLPADFSREKFVKLLSVQPVGLLSLKEFGGLLAAMQGKEYMAGLKELLTELYDGPDSYTRALQRETVTIERPAITILAATTLDWLESRITVGDLRGGFLGRFLFVTARQKSSKKTITGGVDGLVQYHLKEHLAELMKREPARAQLQPEALATLTEWIESWEEEVTSSHHSADLTGFAVRLQTAALKLAMLFRASACYGTQEDPSVIDERSARQAIAYCRVLWRSVVDLVDEQISIGERAASIRRVQQIIGEGIARSEALRLSHMLAKDFQAVLDTLVQSGQFVVESRRPAEVGLERVRQRPLEWISRVEPTFTPAATEFAPIVRTIRASSSPEPQANDANDRSNANGRNPKGPSHSEIPYSYTTHTHTDSIESRVESRARGNSEPKDQPPPGHGPPPPSAETTDEAERWG